MLALARKKSTTRTNNSYGFSLVELLVVVAILAVLAAIAIPIFLNQKNKAKSATLKSDIRALISEVVAVSPNNPSSSFASVDTFANLKASIDSSGYRKTGTNTVIVQFDCKADPSGSVIPAAGKYFLRGYVNNGATNKVTGTTVYEYDSATGVWLEDTSGFGTLHWQGGNDAVANATCPQQYW